MLDFNGDKNLDSNFDGDEQGGTEREAGYHMAAAGGSNDTGIVQNPQDGGNGGGPGTGGN